MSLDYLDTSIFYQAFIERKNLLKLEITHKKGNKMSQISGQNRRVFRDIFYRFK